MIRPVDAAISQRFGDNPTKNLAANDPLILQFGNYQPDGHSGEDYSCPVGTPVRAVTDGTVLHIGWMGGTYDQNPWWVAPNFAGYCAVIDHGSFIGIYGHGSDGSAKVAKGDHVSEGQVFILSGNTGGSTGPHLHFEILPDGYILQSAFYGRIDPEPLFSGITPQSATITPLEEDMPISDADVDRIAAAVHGRHALRPDGTYNTLEWSLGAETQRTEGIIARAGEAAAAATLNTQVPRPNGGTNTLAWSLGAEKERTDGIGAIVLNQKFTLPDGTVTNLAGILTAINAKPAVANTVTTQAADPAAIVSAIKAQWNK